MSSSSSTMSSSSTTSKSMLGQSGMPSLGGMPDMGMMMGKGLDIEELSTAGTDVTGPPDYTVTSPRPSVASPPSASVDAFKQTHKVPAGIDLDQMTSSFSS